MSSVRALWAGAWIAIAVALLLHPAASLYFGLSPVSVSAARLCRALILFAGVACMLVWSGRTRRRLVAEGYDPRSASNAARWGPLSVAGPGLALAGLIVAMIAALLPGWKGGNAADAVRALVGGPVSLLLLGGALCGMALIGGRLCGTAPHCRRCGYPANKSACCSECGRDLAMAGAVRRGIVQRPRWMWLTCVAICIAVAGSAALYGSRGAPQRILSVAPTRLVMSVALRNHEWTDAAWNEMRARNLNEGERARLVEMCLERWERAGSESLGWFALGLLHQEVSRGSLSPKNMRRLMALLDAPIPRDWRNALLYERADALLTNEHIDEIARQMLAEWSGSSVTSPSDEELEWFARMIHSKRLGSAERQTIEAECRRAFLGLSPEQGGVYSFDRDVAAYFLWMLAAEPQEDRASALAWLFERRGFGALAEATEEEVSIWINSILAGWLTASQEEQLLRGQLVEEFISMRTLRMLPHEHAGAGVVEVLRRIHDDSAPAGSRSLLRWLEFGLDATPKEIVSEFEGAASRAPSREPG